MLSSQNPGHRCWAAPFLFAVAVFCNAELGAAGEPLAFDDRAPGRTVRPIESLPEDRATIEFQPAEIDIGPAEVPTDTEFASGGEQTGERGEIPEPSLPAANSYDEILNRLSALEEAAANSAFETKPNDGWIDVSTEKWTVKLGGHVQLDYVNWADADPAITGPAAAPGTKDYFEFRRLRLVADGTGYGVFDFRLQMTLEPETVGETANVVSPGIKDAYLSMNEIPWLGRWRIGNFFVPFSLEQVTNDTNNIFMERSIPTQGIFAADR